MQLKSYSYIVKFPGETIRSVYTNKIHHKKLRYQYLQILGKNALPNKQSYLVIHANIPLGISWCIMNLMRGRDCSILPSS